MFGRDEEVLLEDSVVSLEQIKGEFRMFSLSGNAFSISRFLIMISQLKKDNLFYFKKKLSTTVLLLNA